MSQSGFVLWFTGLSGAGKTTIARQTFRKLRQKKIKAEHLDGDTVRRHLSPRLGFSKAARRLNIKRVAYICSLLSRNEVGVVASFISPYASERRRARKICTNFIEIYINTPLEICEKRDKKGLYQQARAGKIKHFTGISDPYEVPVRPQLKFCADRPGQAGKIADQIIQYLERKKLFKDET